jgi:hypothetical protein
MSRDFERLTRVRERRRSRRKRLVGVLSTLGVAVVVLAASEILAPILPGRWLAARLDPWLSREAPALAGEAQGRVATIEPKAGIIHVASGFLGLMSVELVVTNDTLIVVGDKEGGFGDIREGGLVRAIYAVDRNRLRAKRVEVLSPRPHIASPASSR